MCSVTLSCTFLGIGILQFDRMNLKHLELLSWANPLGGIGRVGAAYNIGSKWSSLNLLTIWKSRESLSGVLVSNNHCLITKKVKLVNKRDRTILKAVLGKKLEMNVVYSFALYHLV